MRDDPRPPSPSFPPHAFNCGDQDTLTWRQRADVCVDLLERLDYAASSQGSIADIGCGDQKLRVALRARGVTCRYQGYDVLPQDPEVESFDVQRDVLPIGHDLAVLLGVSEYLEDLDGVIGSLARQVPDVIVSHVLRQHDYYSPERLAALGWRNHFSESELHDLLGRNGFAVIQGRFAPDQRTLVLLCRSARFESHLATNRDR